LVEATIQSIFSIFCDDGTHVDTSSARSMAKSQTHWKSFDQHTLRTAASLRQD
jgi:hypothetical protein